MHLTMARVPLLLSCPESEAYGLLPPARACAPAALTGPTRRPKSEAAGLWTGGSANSGRMGVGVVIRRQMRTDQ